MLVLSRKSNESVVVGGSEGLTRLLKITVLEITGNRVSLGFEGDPAIAVNRLEVWARRNGGDPTKEPQAAPPSLKTEIARSANGGGVQPSGPPAKKS